MVALYKKETAAETGAIFGDGRRCKDGSASWMRGRCGDGSLHGRLKALQRWQRVMDERPLREREPAWEMEGV